MTLVYPIAATALDFFSSNGSPFGTFGAGAYSQRDFLPVMQIASFTGLWGITFIMSWFASLVNYIWENGFKLNRLALTSAGLAVLVGLLLWFGVNVGMLPGPMRGSEQKLAAGAWKAPQAVRQPAIKATQSMTNRGERDYVIPDNPVTVREPHHRDSRGEIG